MSIIQNTENYENENYEGENYEVTGVVWGGKLILILGSKIHFLKYSLASQYEIQKLD